MILDQSVIGAGGVVGQLSGSIGQAIASSPAQLCHGFWCVAPVVAHAGAGTLVYQATFGDVAIICTALAVLAFRVWRGVLRRQTI